MSASVQKASLVIMLFCFSVWSSLQQESENQADKNPMIRITSLQTKLDIPTVLAKVSDDVSRATGLDKNLITYYWQTFGLCLLSGLPGSRH